jgi:membrane-bound serine protease (ClpP class)
MFFVWALALTGLFLIFLEFFLPGGIMAIGGSVLLLASLFVFHMAQPKISYFILYLFSLLGAVSVVVRFALWRVRSTAKKGTIFLASDQEGFQASVYPKELIGKTGLAATDLKPSGHIWIEDRTFQALSQAGYIDKGTPIQILGGHGSHLIVQPIHSPEVKP